MPSRLSVLSPSPSALAAIRSVPEQAIEPLSVVPMYHLQVVAPLLSQLTPMLLLAEMLAPPEASSEILQLGMTVNESDVQVADDPPPSTLKTLVYTPGESPYVQFLSLQSTGSTLTVDPLIRNEHDVSVSELVDVHLVPKLFSTVPSGGPSIVHVGAGVDAGLFTVNLRSQTP